MSFRGDWPWLSWAFALAGHGALQFCWLCGADYSDEAPMTAVDQDAVWRRRLVTHWGFLMHRLARGMYLSEVFSFPGFLLDYIHIDWMHCVCLGVAPVVLGNILFELFQEELGGVINRPNEALSRLLVYLQDAAHQLGDRCPFSKLTVGLLRGMDRSHRSG